MFEFAAWLSSSMIIVRNVCTFSRLGYAGTILDIKLASEFIAIIIIVWEVSEECTGIDYLYKVFSFNDERRLGGYNAWRKPKWNVSKLNTELLVSTVESGGLLCFGQAQSRLQRN